MSRAWLTRLLPDFAPARDNPAFRRLLAGGLLSALGGSMTSFAVVLQVWDLSRSSLAVGLLGLTFVPVLVVGLLGGSAADVLDLQATAAGLRFIRRRALLVAAFLTDLDAMLLGLLVALFPAFARYQARTAPSG